MKFHAEPFWWSLFGAGGAISALVLPVLLVFFGIAMPFGWVDVPSYEYLHQLVEPLMVRLILLAIISLSLFHWAHRFRFTLYDGFQLHRINLLIAIICYGSAVVITVYTAYSLWNF
ncbi:MAG: fumarate reductase subunit D [Bacteroidetes bacterium]|nr:fumarate reductase subunit D [Bacteroidota bacterium]MCH8233131.1 fumarate reductase subunit D [Bacteroidota bacterium]